MKSLILSLLFTLFLLSSVEAQRLVFTPEVDRYSYTEATTFDQAKKDKVFQSFKEAFLAKYNNGMGRMVRINYNTGTIEGYAIRRFHSKRKNKSPNYMLEAEIKFVIHDQFYELTVANILVSSLTDRNGQRFYLKKDDDAHYARGVDKRVVEKVQQFALELSNVELGELRNSIKKQVSAAPLTTSTEH